MELKHPLCLLPQDLTFEGRPAARDALIPARPWRGRDQPSTSPAGSGLRVFCSWNFCQVAVGKRDALLWLELQASCRAGFPDKSPRPHLSRLRTLSGFRRDLRPSVSHELRNLRSSAATRFCCSGPQNRHVQMSPSASRALVLRRIRRSHREPDCVRDRSDRTRVAGIAPVATSGALRRGLSVPHPSAGETGKE